MTYTVVDVEPDTVEWEEERRNSIGASEAAAAIGESSYDETPLKLYLSKIGAGRDEFDPILSLIGHGEEPIISEWVSRWHPEIGEVLPGFMARSTEHPHLHATFDRLVRCPDGRIVPLQLKTSTVFVKHKWSLGVPVDYQVQEEVECLVYGAPFAYLAVHHTGTTQFELYRLPSHEDRQAEIVRKTGDLWHEHIVPRRPPLATLGDDLNRLYPPQEGKQIRADQDALDNVLFLKETAAMRLATEREYKAQEADAKFALEQYMKDATELINPYTGEVAHTWKPNKNGQRRHYTP